MIQTEDWGSGDEQQAAPAPQKPIAPSVPPAPQVEQTEPQSEQPVAPESASGFPNDLKASFALLQKAQEEWDNAPILPVYKLKSQKLTDGNILAIRRAAQQKLKRLQAHVFKLQQGMPTLEIDAEHMAEMQLAQNPKAIRDRRAARLAELASKNPAVAKMLSK